MQDTIKTHQFMANKGLQILLLLLLVGAWGCNFESENLKRAICTADKDCEDGLRCIQEICVSLDDYIDVQEPDLEGIERSCSEVRCEAGQDCCGYQCIDTSEDPLNCGGCGVTCADNEVCSSGQCHCGAPSESSCDPNNYEMCCLETFTSNLACTIVQFSPEHCGFCGNTCTTSDPTLGTSSEICSDGDCLCMGEDSSLQRCGLDQECCAAPSGCSNLNTDPQNCGACGSECGKGELCISGRCACGGQRTTGEPACSPAQGLLCCGDPPSCVEESDSSCYSETRLCASHEVLCDETCVNPSISATHCGAGANCNTSPGAVCAAGAGCVAGECRCGLDGVLCSTAEGSSCQESACVP